MNYVNTLARVAILASISAFTICKKEVQKTKGDFYLTDKGIEQYIEIAEGYDGRELVEKLKKYVAKGATVLELGMGPGKDLDMLKTFYQATGSDYSPLFLEKYRKEHPDADLLELDAVTLVTDRKFDAIYSNKVLHHLKHQNLIASIKRQSEILSDTGVVCHTFWNGDKDMEIEGLYFHYLTPAQVRKVFEKEFEILEMDVYREMEENDSIYILARKK